MPAADDVTTVDGARAAELASLCRACGMCCDGSLFGAVDLARGEADVARRRGLRLLASETAFEQPCAALVPHGPAAPAPTSGARECSMYDERPRSCRRFTCRLYERHLREGGPLGERLATVRRARALVARAEGPEGPTAWPSPADPALTADELRELERTMDEDFARACGSLDR